MSSDLTVFPTNESGIGPVKALPERTTFSKSGRPAREGNDPESLE